MPSDYDPSPINDTDEFAIHKAPRWRDSFRSAFLPFVQMRWRQHTCCAFLLHIERSNWERYYDPLFIKPLFQHFYKGAFYEKTIKILSGSQHYGQVNAGIIKGVKNDEGLIGFNTVLVLF